MRFARQGYWSGLPSPSPGDLPNPGIEPGSPALQVDSLPAELQGKPFSLSPFCGAGVRQEYWSGLLSPSPGDLPDPGIEPGSSTLQADALPSEPRVQAAYLLWWLLLSQSMGCGVQA